MRYYVHSNSIGKQCGVYLNIDNWDDWFTYSTMYYVQYVDTEENVYDIGSIKIGEYNMKEGQRRPSIPLCFEFLDNKFFSVGQSTEYYENLKLLDAEIREMVLADLNDMAFNLDIYAKCKTEDVTKVSLMRELTETTIRNQFHRMAHGGARLTRYEFGFEFPSIIKYGEKSFEVENPAKLTFHVIPESNPPTNIHVIIGRNGVGKTFLIKNMINSALKREDCQETGHFFEPTNGRDVIARSLFANLICIGFSAFDNLSLLVKENLKYELPYVFIGLDDNSNMDSDFRFEKLKMQFSESLLNCFTSKRKRELWHRTMEILNYDNFFAESGITEIDFEKDSSRFKKISKGRFEPLSSGHKIILLTITRLVEVVEEKSFIIFDEPETHLYPPLLSAFIRALSYILIENNGVALITTHSPIIIQEVPSGCVWKMHRTRSIVNLERPIQETFGTNINSLIREIFGLEVEKSGFHQMLKEAAKNNEYSMEAVMECFNHELGDEAKAILRLLIALKEQAKYNYEET